MKSLRERLAAAMQGPPPVSQVELAKAAGVSQPSVNDWLSGKTKSIRGPAQSAVAAKLGVNPDWLATGKGPMHGPALPQSHLVGISADMVHHAQTLLWMYLAFNDRPADQVTDPDYLAAALRVVLAEGKTEPELAVMLMTSMKGIDDARRMAAPVPDRPMD